MTKSISIISLFLVLFSCSNNNNQEKSQTQFVSKSDSLYKAVMNGHNEGMSKMGALTRYQNAVNHLADSVSHLKTKTPEISKLKAKLDSSLNNLKAAENSMNVWMQEFDPDKAGKTEEEKIKYYESELKKVNKVEEDIHNSLAQAKEITGK